MDLWMLLQALIRRWYVAVPLLAVTAVSTVALTDSVLPEYEVSGAVLLVGPGRSDEVIEELPGQDNRLLQLSGSLGTVSQALGFTIGSQRVRSEFADAGLLPDYQLGTDSRSPIMQFIVAGEDPDLVVATMDALIVFVEDELNRTQDELGTPPNDRIEVRAISSDNQPSEGLSSRRRAQILLLAVGLLVTIAATITVDALLRIAGDRRARRKRRRAAAAATDGTNSEDSSGPPSTSLPGEDEIARFEQRSMALGEPGPATGASATPGLADDLFADDTTDDVANRRLAPGLQPAATEQGAEPASGRSRN